MISNLFCQFIFTAKRQGHSNCHEGPIIRIVQFFTKNVFHLIKSRLSMIPVQSQRKIRVQNIVNDRMILT